MDRYVLVLPLKSFEGYVEGVPALALMTERLAHLIVNHYLRLLHDPLWGADVVHVEDQPGSDR
jgi:hypothetical protein